MRNYKFSIVAITLYLFIFAVIGRLGAPLYVMAMMFAFSPLLLIWMVVVTIKFGKYKGKELQVGEEWVYEDISKNQLNTVLSL